MRKRILANPGLIGPFFQSEWNRRWGDGSKAYYPREIILSVNNNCNAHCSFCDIGMKNRESVFHRNIAQPDKASMSLDLLHKIVDEIKFFKPEIDINYVEPLLYENLLDGLRLIKANNLKTHIVTNGILLEEAAEDLVNVGLDRIIVSIDGSEELHDRNRGPGVFQKAVNGIRAITRYRRAHSRTPRLWVNCVISDQNYMFLSELADYLLRVEKVDRVRFHHLMFVTAKMRDAHNETFSAFGEASAMSDSVNLSAIDSGVLWKQLEEIKARFHPRQLMFVPDLIGNEAVHNYYHRPESSFTDRLCHSPWHSMSIQSDGNVVVRSRCLRYEIGNISLNSFNEIWNGEKYQAFRRQIKLHGLFPVCSRCSGIM